MRLATPARPLSRTAGAASRIAKELRTEFAKNRFLYFAPHLGLDAAKDRVHPFSHACLSEFRRDGGLRLDANGEVPSTIDTLRKLSKQARKAFSRTAIGVYVDKDCPA